VVLELLDRVLQVGLAVTVLVHLQAVVVVVQVLLA
jgi:hypothetical protein